MRRPSLETIFCSEAVPLPQTVASHLARESGRNAWDDTLLILPTAETGRRVIAALLRGRPGTVIFPPRCVTPLSLVPFGVGDGVATAVQAQLAWRRAIELAPAYPLTFGEKADDGARSAFAEPFVGLTRSLAAANHTIGTAAAALSEKDARWTEWIDLWKSYLRVLKAASLECPANAQIAAARDFVLPEGCDQVIVAGVRDMPPLAWVAIEKSAVKMLIHAPGIANPESAFGDRGQPCAAFWKSHEIAIPDSQIHVVGSFDELAAATANLVQEASGSAAIICGDAALGNEIATRLADEGVKARLPEGFPISRHPIPRLAALLLRLGAQAGWDDFETLLRHPDFIDWLDRERIWSERDFSLWRDFGTNALRPDIGNLRPRWNTLSDDEREKFDRLAPLVALFEKLHTQFAGEDPARELRTIFERIYGPLDLNRRPGDKDAAKCVVRILDEIRAVPALGSPDARALSSLLDALPGTWSPDQETTSIDIEGWLELAGEDAESLIVAGLNEGLLPTRRRIDPLLPDSARSILGLDDNRSREARDAAILSAAVHVRGDRLVVLSAQRTSDGTPLKPSRFLLRIPDRELPSRLLRLCENHAPGESVAALPFTSAPLRVPRAERSADTMNVTDFSAYLACPLRFYLSRRLGMRTPGDIHHCLEHDTFGAWIHEVLHEFGRDDAINNSSDAEEIRDFLLPRWDRRFERFGADVDLYLQREAGRMRLEEFALRQAEIRAEGWRIRRSEWRIHAKDGLQIPGWPLTLRGRIDRIDQCGEELRLIDYKTGALGPGKSEHVVRARHLKKGIRDAACVPDFACFGEEFWTDLQLPLYAIALQTLAPPDLSGRASLAYFLLPDDAKKAGLFEWNPSGGELESAANCARSIMQEVADEAVCQWIAEGKLDRFTVAPRYDDFESLALDRFLESHALEVAS